MMLRVGVRSPLGHTMCKPSLAHNIRCLPFGTVPSPRKNEGLHRLCRESICDPAALERLAAALDPSKLATIEVCALSFGCESFDLFQARTISKLRTSLFFDGKSIIRDNARL